MSISLYIALYYNLLLLLVVYIAIQPVRAETVRQPYINNQIFSLALLLIVYVHVTFRPTDYHYFGDTSAYAMAFQKKAFYGTVAIRDRDIGFEYLTYWLSQLVNLKGYWFVLCSLYILPVFFALTYIIHSGFISGYQNRYGDNLKPPTNVYHRMTA